MPISSRTIKRLILYKRYLEELEKTGKEKIFSHDLAEHFSLTPAMVRKDFSSFGSKGVFNEGYTIAKLLKKKEEVEG